MLRSYYDAASPPVPLRRRRPMGGARTANDQLNVQQSVDTRAALADYCKRLRFSAVNAWLSLATSATVPPLQSGLGTFDLGSVLCILPYASPSDLHFRLKIKSCSRKRKKSEKKKKKKKAAEVSRRSECLFSVLSCSSLLLREAYTREGT